jgi:hypothetical protein
MFNFAKDLAAALDALRRHAILFLFGVTLIALALLGRSWLDAHDASLRLQATLTAQQKTITDADQRQTTRDAQLTQTLQQIANAKQRVQSPTQAANALPQAVSQLIANGPTGKPLPSPITIELPPTNGSANSQNNSNPAAQNANASTRDLRSAGILPAGSSPNSQNENNWLEAGATNSSMPTKKYPWTAIKLGLTKLGLAHTTPPAKNSVPANGDLENREGTTAAQKGSSAQQSTSSQSTAASSALINVAAQAKSASNSQTNSPPQTDAAANANSNGILQTRDATNNAASANSATQSGTTTPQNNSAASPPAIIRVPQEDLKPLYDAVEDCQACQAKLTAVQGDLSDERTKFDAATAERDAALRVARGTFWTRTRTAAKWIIIGAAAGAVLSRYH